ncbi:MAG TPA: choice-of-anchor O protein, partial [Symbiobacteriaceae bacterium]|nr:choice-of-anchor O protein [Symbiobacteriaceae bacterium]
MRVRRVFTTVLVLAMAVSALWAPTASGYDAIPTDYDYGPAKYIANLVVAQNPKAKVVPIEQNLGTVEVWNNARDLFVRVRSTEWLIAGVQIYVGGTPVPVTMKNPANPDLKKFPYITEYKKPVPEHMQTISLSDDLGVSWGSSSFEDRIQNVAVHVDLVQLNKAGKVSRKFDTWAEGPRILGVASGIKGKYHRYLLVKPRYGHFIDGPVSGLNFRTPTFEGLTDDKGGFDYYPGEPLEISLGNLVLGTILADDRLTPLDIVGTDDMTDTRVVNMARLLQSLDVNGTPKNGIAITPKVKQCLAEAAGELGIVALDLEESEQIDALIETTIAQCAGVEGVSLAEVSVLDAVSNLAKSLSGVKFEKNISDTPDLASDKARLELAQFYIPAQKANDDPTEIEYYDVYGNLIETRTEAKPLIVIYTDAMEGTGGTDLFGAISRDDGNTWKQFNLSRIADRSSFDLENGTEYPGMVSKPAMTVKGNQIFVAWTSSFCSSGNPRYAIDTADEYIYDDPYYTDDIWGVAGQQGSTDYTELGFPEVGELPYYCIWSVRGLIEQEDPVDKPDAIPTGEITWFKPERLTSGRRNAMQIAVNSAGNNAGFAVIWEEDPEGIRPGKGAGPGVGWSGAIANHGTDIWYSFVKGADFAKIDTHFVPGGESQSEHPDIRNRPKALVPMSLPVRISDNEMLNTDNMKVELDENGNPIVGPDGKWVPMRNEDGKAIGEHRYGYTVPNVCASFYEFVNQQGALKKVCVTSDGRLMDGDTAGTRPALFLQPYKKTDGTYSAWAIVGYEESKGLGGGDPTQQHEEDEVIHEPGQGQEDWDPDVGKNIQYHSFDFTMPDTVSAGSPLNPQAVDAEGNPLWVLDPEGNPLLDWQGNKIQATENARRPRFIVQPKSQACEGKLDTEECTVMVAIYKMGEEGRGGPSDIFIQRWVLKPTTTGNPYRIQNLKGYSTPKRGVINISSVTPGEVWTNPDSDPTNPDQVATKVITWTQSAANLNDYSWTFPDDEAHAHRGFIKGDFLIVGYSWTANWKAARNGNDNYNLFIRRSFDGGATFTTAPAAEPYNGVGIDYCYFYKEPQTGEILNDTCMHLNPGDFEPARNISMMTNYEETVIEPRISGLPGSIADSPYPEDQQDISRVWLFWGTGLTPLNTSGSADEEDLGKAPLDLYYVYSLDFGETYIYQEQVVQGDGNKTGETVLR